MGEKRPLKIDMDELRSAIEDNSYEHEYYLDLVTGEIIYFSEYVDDEERGKLRDRIDDNPSHYEQIPKEEPREGYENMRAFIATLDNKHLVELLEVAINGKGAFRRFKDVLLNYPEERERWFQFKDARIQEQALEWLNNIDIILIEEKNYDIKR